MCIFGKCEKSGVVMYVKDELKPKLVSVDKDGRVLVVEIVVESKKILLVGIYAPNGAKENFFTKLKQKLERETYEYIMVMGDFNRVVDPLMDKSSKKGEGDCQRYFLRLQNKKDWKMYGGMLI